MKRDFMWKLLLGIVLVFLPEEVHRRFGSQPPGKLDAPVLVRLTLVGFIAALVFVLASFLMRRFLRKWPVSWKIFCEFILFVSLIGITVLCGIALTVDESGIVQWR
jgi:hypothetical protein